MFAGKTTKILAIYDVLTKLGYPVLCFKAEVDGSGGIGHTSSHDERPLPVIFVNPNTPGRILRHLGRDGVKKVILDAIHFFPKKEIEKIVRELLRRGVDVYATGLLYDFRRQPFGATLSLFKRADEKIELFAICVRCGAKASHTERLVGGAGQIVSSRQAEYIPVCRAHHRIYKKS